jgi:hypothetical protein
MKLIQILNNLFNVKLQTPLELYIASKYPTCAADIENLSREYYNKSTSGYFC